MSSISALRRGTPAKDDPTSLARTLLYGSTVEPVWTKLPSTVKHALFRTIRAKHTNIHSPAFYEALRAIWKNNKVLSDAKNIATIDCAICLDPYKLDGKDKITTMMCGHKFCSDCIFKDIARSLHRNLLPRCPLCRQDVLPTSLPETRTTANGVDIEAQRIEQRRQRRRDERRAKHQHRREQKESGTIVNTR